MPSDEPLSEGHSKQKPTEILPVELGSSSHLGYLRAVSEHQAEEDRKVVLAFMQKVDPGIIRVTHILTNPNNQEWLATVVYADGKVGCVEGDGVVILRQTFSEEKLLLIADYDEDFQAEVRLEEREP